LAADAASLAYAPISPNLPLYDVSFHTSSVSRLHNFGDLVVLPIAETESAHDTLHILAHSHLFHIPDSTAVREDEFKAGFRAELRPLLQVKQISSEKHDTQNAAKVSRARVTDMHDLRVNERAVDLAPACDVALRFIGTIRTPWQSREECPRQGRLDGPECRLVLDPVWHDALRGLEDYQTIEVLYWLDKSRRDLVLQSPKRDGQTVGTFALRSPVRPNPIGTSMVKLERIEAGTVFVRGLDCLDGTPLIDIKPDRCTFTPKAPPKPGDAQARDEGP
jgi:tRNA-Thr(GGU) m(6)t(6)A37 methyltransferase TsaA